MIEVAEIPESSILRKLPDTQCDVSRKKYINYAKPLRLAVAATLVSKY